MKIAIRISTLILVLLFIHNISIAQEIDLTKEYKEQVVQKLSDLMNNFYVFPEVAKKTEAHLMVQLKDGHFDQYKNDETFAQALTESVQSINKDKHMRIRKNRPYVAPESTPERKIEERLDRINRTRGFNSGFNTVKIMEGNVGYLDYRGFAGFPGGKSVTDAYMKLLSQSDAIIIDLSKNGGGDPSMVQYICSFFFDQKVHLNSLYYRDGDRTIDYWTLDEVEGAKMPDVPLFVITSDRTFSGAEEFSYNMQTQKRATLIGQTSGGGANPGGTRGINENLSVFIPTGRAINPITKTNWEGVGVIPEIQTTKEEALVKAHELAIVAAEEFRNKQKGSFTKVYMDLINYLNQNESEKSDEAILQKISECVEENLLTEGDINMLGYEYLLTNKKPKIALSVFKANTTLHPNSSNVFDSYAEALMMEGDLRASIKNYQKAVDISAKNEDGDLEFYKMNLEKAKEKLKADK